MSLNKVTPGSKVPEVFNVIIEIPMNSDPVKYEVDKESGALFVDRFMGTAMHYPTNYGYVPQTIAGDGDPVDVLVMTPFPLPPGVVVPCRALGILLMEDEGGVDGKVLAVPTEKILARYSGWIACILRLATTSRLPGALRTASTALKGVRKVSTKWPGRSCPRQRTAHIGWRIPRLRKRLAIF